MTDQLHTQALSEPALEPLRRVQLRVLRGPDRDQCFVLDAHAPVSVGLAPGNDVRLTDRTVSRYHLEMRIEDRGIHLRDLGSLNGTYVAGIRLVDAHLQSGATIGLGNTLLAVTRLEDAVCEAQSEVAPVEELVAENPVMRELVRQIRCVAPTATAVLIQGETGTGKEVVARSLHKLSRRASGPFEVVDCGAMPANLISSELFGHERGAFTGAHRLHLGAFERARGGTLFLDEIGELPLELQPMLLGALERKVFRRLGGSSEIRADVRVVAATHRDLREAANLGTFRADLYYRLAVARLVIPPLRERPSDIPELVRRFVQELTGARAPLPFDEFTLASLKVQFFPGNVRELRNLVESAVAFGSASLVAPPSLVPQGEAPSSRPPPSNPLATYGEAREQAIGRFEQDYLSQLMAHCQNNASEASRRAKMDRPYLLKLLRKHGLR